MADTVQSMVAPDVSPDEQDGWQAAGFYAIAYDWNGERAISYSNTIH